MGILVVALLAPSAAGMMVGGASAVTGNVTLYFHATTHEGNLDNLVGASTMDTNAPTTAAGAVATSEPFVTVTSDAQDPATASWSWSPAGGFALDNVEPTVTFWFQALGDGPLIGHDWDILLYVDGSLVADTLATHSVDAVNLYRPGTEPPMEVVALLPRMDLQGSTLVVRIQPHYIDSDGANVLLYDSTSFPSNVALVNPGAGDTTPPSQVTGLAQTGATGSSITLAWNASTDDTGIDHYDVYRSADANASGALVGTPAGTSFQDGGLAMATTYYYRVTAVDLGGNEGPASAELAATTASAGTGGHDQSLTLANTMVFTPRNVTAITGAAQDLYEPSVTVAPDGAIYTAMHAVGAYTTRAPAAVSTDGGITWHGLPGAVNASPVADTVQGGGDVNGDEGVITTDALGHAWMLDNSAESNSLYTWCNDGSARCGYDPVNWNIVQNSAAFENGCSYIDNVADRPWNAFGHGKVLLQNNNGGQAQIGVYDPATGNTSWNDCASPNGASTWIPGPGSVRDADGAFGVPQIATVNNVSRMNLITGNVDDGPGNLRTLSGLFKVSSTALACSSNFGFTGVSADGTFWVAGAETPNTIAISASPDLANFSTLRFHVGTGEAITYLSIVGSQTGEGALLEWGATTGPCSSDHLYVAHVHLDASGVPHVSDASLVTITSLYGDYTLAGVGPDGNATVVTTVGATVDAGVHPTVWVQTGGPTV